MWCRETLDAINAEMASGKTAAEAYEAVGIVTHKGGSTVDDSVLTDLVDRDGLASVLEGLARVMRGRSEDGGDKDSRLAFRRDAVKLERLAEKVSAN